MSKVWLFLALAFATLDSVLSKHRRLPPPLPVLPLPSAAQLRWQQRELVMFFHFGMNTFTDSEWGSGHEDPRLFNPSFLDASQWVKVAADAGFSLVILTAKHHDGFCLWPSKYTDHSVKSSPWKNGEGDVVREFMEAAQARDLDVGLYLSPWDRHERTYGLQLEYNEYYMGQLQELLDGEYGHVSEIWFDGAKGNNTKNMTYHFNDWFSTVKRMQGSINIFSDAGPDVRWVGGETGTAGTTCWSPINRTSLRIGDGSIIGYLNTGDSNGSEWVPPECDVSIRPGWFWHKNETPKAVDELLHIYYTSVGRNCVLLLNVPPNSTGLISEPDVNRLTEFRSAVTTIFSANLAEGAVAKGSSQRGGRSGGFLAANVLADDPQSYWAPADSDEDPWIELRLEKPAEFNVVRIQEAITLGQRIIKHEVYVKFTSVEQDERGLTKGERVANGTTVGYKRLHRLGRVVRAQAVWVRVTEARGPPLISSIGLHFDPYSKSQIS
ncbi:alpha-L-fucosidase 1-like [Nymphaea colorata]|nr:alpha-L-fucosidase 1-like [Nymphaea colorata]XP_031495163.1 alpha-L-fucosidase 1-like [Nymphaea colorata]